MAEHLTMEEIRHLTERLPGAFAQIARALGMTASEFRTAIEQGRVSCDAFAHAYATIAGPAEGQGGSVVSA